jgi:hypothetical protein
VLEVVRHLEPSQIIVEPAERVTGRQLDERAAQRASEPSQIIPAVYRELCAALREMLRAMALVYEAEREIDVAHVTGRWLIADARESVLRLDTVARGVASEVEHARGREPQRSDLA